MKRLSRAKILWKFVYSEIRCGRQVSIKDKDLLYYAKYADLMKNRTIPVSSPELRVMIERNKEKLFLKNLFKF